MEAGKPPGWLDARHRRMLGWVVFGTVVTGALAGLAVLSLALGTRLAAAGFALATLAAAPLIAVGPAIDWWRHRRPRRQGHARRPGGFPPGQAGIR